MPIYDYKCIECGNEFECMNIIEERQYSECGMCGAMAPQVMSACHFDPKMGLDPDFPTAYKKWGDNLKARTSGRMKDSNNLAYGTDRDIEKDAYDLRKKTGG